MRNKREHKIYIERKTRTPSKALHERADDPPLIGRAHEQAEPMTQRTRRPSITVHVRVCGARRLVVHDVVHSGDVEPTRGDVRCEQDAARCAFESVEGGKEVMSGERQRTGVDEKLDVHRSRFFSRWRCSSCE